MNNLDTKNVNFDFLQDIFLEEAWKSIDKIDAFLDGKYSDPKEIVITKEESNQIFRVLHSFKGSAFMMGHQTIAEMIHGAEDLFSYLQEEDTINQKDLETILRLTKTVSSCVKKLKRMETGKMLQILAGQLSKELKIFCSILMEKKWTQMQKTCSIQEKEEKIIPFQNFDGLLQKQKEW